MRACPAHDSADACGQLPQCPAATALLGGRPGKIERPHPGPHRQSRQIFTDPTRFDITRANARDHLAFASGVHACLGAALARIEGVTALRALFDAFPDLQLIAPPQRRGLVNLRGYTSLPAQLGSKRLTTADLPT